jgi:hypothetical protein
VNTGDCEKEGAKAEEEGALPGFASEPLENYRRIACPFSPSENEKRDRRPVRLAFTRAESCYGIRRETCLVDLGWQLAQVLDQSAPNITRETGISVLHSLLFFALFFPEAFCAAGGDGGTVASSASISSTVGKADFRAAGNDRVNL